MVSTALPAKWGKVQAGVVIFLYLGLAGNLFITYTNYFTSAEYRQAQKIYTNTTLAIKHAQSVGMPVFILPGIAYPYGQAVIDAGKPDPAVWVLQTLPAYNMRQHILVQAIYPERDMQEIWTRSATGVDSALVGDGVAWHVLRR